MIMSTNVYNPHCNHIVQFLAAPGQEQNAFSPVLRAPFDQATLDEAVHLSADIAFVEHRHVGDLARCAKRCKRRYDAPLEYAETEPARIHARRPQDGAEDRDPESRDVSEIVTFIRWTIGRIFSDFRRDPVPATAFRIRGGGFRLDSGRWQDISASVAMVSSGKKVQSRSRARRFEPSRPSATSLHIRNRRFPGSYGLSGITVTRCRRSRTVIVSSVPTAAYSGCSMARASDLPIRNP